jgi:hypothetical protein
VNGFNRLVMIIIALLLIVVPVLLLLITFGVVPSDQVNAVTGYRSAVSALGNLSSDFNLDAPEARIVFALVGFLLVLVAGYLLLRELTFGRQVARKTLIEDEPGRETAITSGAVRQLAEAAAQEAGAASPSCSLATEKDRYEVDCDIRVPGSENYTELATRSKDNIQRVLQEQHVPVKDVEVTVQGTASQG